ncbi:hypothetical protein BJY04DRAFT_223373 [Aspergillus karnatakaensis]|uniref:putative quinol monooxygenase n=1 Tax=Aspergillus karnatakaensis TaxID=1810916 RepID=UPI003CCD7DBB
MYIIAPLSNCASPEKRDRFLEYISKIAPVTLANEPKCHAYAWFRSAEDSDTVPHHWLRGFEVYEDIEANTVAHRASSEYKAFRAAVGEEGLLARPSDLRYWRPSGVGFLSREGDAGDSTTVNFMERNNRLPVAEARQYIVVDELTPQAGKKEAVLQQLAGLAEEAEEEPRVLNFWVLHRGIGEEDEGLLVFSRYKDRNAGTTFMEGTVEAWKTTSTFLEGERRTTWVESGIGFLNR